MKKIEQESKTDLVLEASSRSLKINKNRYIYIILERKPNYDNFEFALDKEFGLCPI